MKNNGLQYRFSQETRAEWLYWYSCLICRMNGYDALHHIVSPSSHLHVAGEHNTSVFNSCPIHNGKHPSADQLARQGKTGFGITLPCHVGNEAYLYKDTTIAELLRTTRNILLVELGYTPNSNDRTFLDVYKHIYLIK